MVLTRIAPLWGLLGQAAPGPAVSIARAADRRNLYLLVQLRWLAVIGQVLTIVVTWWVFGIALPLIQMATVIVLQVGLNILGADRYRRRVDVSSTELLLALLLDVGALTVQLYLSGGAANPFISLYLLQVALGAILLPPRAAWLLVVVTAGCFLLLTQFYRPVFEDHLNRHDFLSLHIAGMFVCLALSAVLLVIFIVRITRNLGARDAHVARLRQQAAEEDHIVRMGLLASGAAHELGTPLATLSVILNDWQHMPALAANAELMQEISEMQGQVERCKSIVSGILLSSGEVRGEGTLRATVNTFMDELVREWRDARSPAHLDYVNRFGSDVAILSDAALRQVLFNLLDNALDASPHYVAVEVARAESTLVITVRDRGPGFAPDMLAALGKPYHSTKGRPGGGLGLFLVVNVIRKLGGTVAAVNEASGGASVTLRLPLAVLSAGGSGAG